MFQVSPAIAGFIKGIVFVVIWAIIAYLADASHLNGLLSPTLATLLASIFSGLESSHKASTDGTAALFGAVQVK